MSDSSPRKKLDLIHVTERKRRVLATNNTKDGQTDRTKQW